VSLEQSDALSGSGEVDTERHGLSESTQVLRVLKLSVGLLVARTRIGDFWAEGFDDVATLIEAVPKASSEFVSAKRHLANAIVYCHQNELGAATFELRALRGKVPHL
jgi:hypothetical protein